MDTAMKVILLVSFLALATTICTARSPPVEFVCPSVKIFFPVESEEPKCQNDNDCAQGKLCCNWQGSKHCLKSVSTVPRQGQCPRRLRTADIPCRADFGGCDFDSECPGKQRCCLVKSCGYSQCSPVRRIRRKRCKPTHARICNRRRNGKRRCRCINKARI